MQSKTTPVLELKKRRILIADDDPSIARALFAIVCQYGNAIVVDSGNKAIDVIKSFELDLILTDYEMNQGSGLDLLTYLSNQNIKTPTIMITAFGSKDLILKTIHHNVFGFIEKPFTPAIVEGFVQRAFKAKDEASKIQELALLGISMGEIVHEINNPLAVLDLTLSSKPDAEAETSEASKMLRSVNKIKNIIVNTQSELRGDNAKNKSEFNFHSVILATQEELHYKAEKKKVSLQFEGDFNFPFFGSAQRIRQILVNLINNSMDAVKDLENKWVKIKLDKRESSLLLRITDAGPGIPPEIQSKLFEPLFSTKGKNGTGLGLGIVRKIANEHGGNVYLNTDSPNTEFVLVLPL